MYYYVFQFKQIKIQTFLNRLKFGIMIYFINTIDTYQIPF